LIEPKFYERLQIHKAVCGVNHVLVLAGKSVFSWGNEECGQTGVNPESKRKVGPLVPKKLPTKNIIDVFSGQNHSFLVCAVGKEKVLKGWGLNVHGQLGMGKTGNIWKPEEIRFFADNNITVKYATGGDFHSLFLTENDELYVCGRNEVNQLGLTEEEFREILNKRKEERIKIIDNSKSESETENEKENKQNHAESQSPFHEDAEIRDDVTKSGMIIDNEKKSCDEIEKVVSDLHLDEENQDLNEEDQELILLPIKLRYFDSATRPIHSIYSSMNFNYALDKINNQAYSWGFGESYVLGNKKDLNQEIPFAIPKGFFFNHNIEQIGVGSQHVVVGLFDTFGENQRPVLEYDVEHYRELLKANQPIKIKAGKRKAEESLQEIREEEGEAKEKNAPRRSIRPKSEKQSEIVAPTRGRSMSKSKTAKKEPSGKKIEKKSKSKSKQKISKNRGKNEKKLDDKEMDVEKEEKVEKKKPEKKSLNSRSKSKTLSKSATKNYQAKSEKQVKSEIEKFQKPKKEKSKSKSKEPIIASSRSAKKK